MATQAAINSWNDVSFCRVNMYYTELYSPDITIRYNSSFAAGEYGLGTWPSNCNPGPTIDLNFQSESMTDSRLHYTIAHEIGHNFGFMHTDLGNFNNFQAPFSPSSDPQSVFNSGPATGLTTDSNSIPQWSSFSEWDISALRAVYGDDVMTQIWFDLIAPQGFFRECLIRWQISRFCSTTVTCKIFKSGVLINKADIPNNANFRPLLTPGVYDIWIHEVGNPGGTILKTGDRTLN
ncbi:hypothetical protein IC229_15625 [Spirosoma sp. BT702]|uniref:Uncharacterized protein n=1 Tax=Spirosoma profusum TaxID=2771354 RepID=A0A926Y3N0_9BACT|nr:M57 family metalloprotease [Spirosoma profusum]MBD2702080.1 hypothetical protein [Spirosoma profusum]